MNDGIFEDEEFFEEVAARLDDLEEAPIVRLSNLVRREGACMWIHVGTEEPTWMGEKATDRELAATICAGCTVVDECLELEFRTAGFTTLGVWGALADDDRRATYLAWLRRREAGSAMKPEHSGPLETEPVSVHAPYIAYPDGQYRVEDAEERHAALLEPLRGVALGAYDQRILHWLLGWDISVVAVVVSLLWRARHAAAQEGRDGGESR
jgi:WhiB family redox-sensing transcriptional regulator